jgi:hypothetical protein
MTSREQELCQKARNKAFQDAIAYAQTHIDNGLAKHYPGDFVAKEIIQGLRALMKHPIDDALLEVPQE